MANVRGRGVKVEIASAYAAAVVVSAVTQANPAAVTATAHGMAPWTVGRFSGVSGMVPIEGQAAVVVGPLTNAFSATGLNSTSFPAFVGTASFTPASAWLTLSECTSYDMSGGSATRINKTTILDRQARSKPGLMAAQVLKLQVLPQTVPSAALVALEAAMLARAAIILRITHPDGSLRACSGDPSYPTENAATGAIGASMLDVAIDGLFLKLAGT